MSTSLIRLHNETKESLDEYISKNTKTYDAIIINLIQKDRNKNKGIVGAVSTPKPTTGSLDQRFDTND